MNNRDGKYYIGLVMKIITNPLKILKIKKTPSSAEKL